MFVQVITGRTTDPAALRARGERWDADLRPGATGYLGGTVGFSDDGRFVTLARFVDEVAAATNSERPEQGAWWAETAALIDGEATFRESSDVSTLHDGGSDSAGFVQIMEGTVSDRAKAESFETPELEAQLLASRPDLLGSIRVWFDGGAYLEAAYFTSEADARAGEASPEFQGPQEDYTALFGEMTFTDLRDLQLTGPA
jgi:hypothetical protein